MPVRSFVLSPEKSDKFARSALPSNASTGARTGVLFVHMFNRGKKIWTLTRTLLSLHLRNSTLCHVRKTVLKFGQCERVIGPLDQVFVVIAQNS